MNLARKVDHVRSAPDEGNHHCHWPGCDTEVKPALWGCKRHWYSLPKAIRDRIWNAYKPGQERSKTPSTEYVAAARAAQDWIITTYCTYGHCNCENVMPQGPCPRGLRYIHGSRT